jgi:xylitol oxidase
MNREEFLKTTSLMMAGGVLSSLPSCNKPEAVVRKNWAGNYQYKASEFHEPKTVDELRSLVKQLESVKALGTRHCFNDIADTPTNQISTTHLNGVFRIDEAASTVTVGAGTRYGDFAAELHAKGFAVHNLASLPHISVAGACATATHGSGKNNGNLATAVRAFSFINMEGDLVSVENDDPDFQGMIVHLGALGILTEVTLNIQPTFLVRQDVFQDLPLDSVKDHFDEIMSAGYSVSLFTDWQDRKVSQVWIKRRTDQDVRDLGKDFFGGRPAEKDLHPITAISAENCTPQMGVAGPWYERLPHFKMGFTPSSGEELQAEYFVPYDRAVDAILAVEQLGDRIFPLLFISEIRTIAADDLWMSPCYKQPCVAIHFTWKPLWENVKKILPVIESALAPFSVKPHWGKLFTITPSVLQSRYPQLESFRKVVKSHDPKGKLSNYYLRNLLGF